MKLHCLTWGDEAAERTAVLIHGVTSNAQSWVRVGPRLAEQGYYVVAPSLRGHGPSPKADGRYSLDEMASDLAENVPQNPTFVIGHSFGGVMAIVAEENGYLNPDYIVLEDPVLHFADKELPALLLKNDEANLPRDLAGVLQANPKWAQADAEGKLASLGAINWDHMKQVFSDNAPWDLRPNVVEIGKKKPIWLILPEESFYVPEADAATLRQALGPEAVVNVPGTGHSIHRDELDTFLTTIQQWIESAGR
ncbi:MAG: alpha/beta hydrolase [Ardenticatenaceae bacterium]|nr:alpha/beta hydrolase [Anaerolineales bacterium]MCB8937302.1 alpha/beta hydrolase [Ardenticatenaceae bacterium]MCB8975504.1 alpha/beta hydrolase [Ardenticatenaceae bacterium]